MAEPKTHYLFLQIITTVAGAPTGISVREIGRQLGYSPAVMWRGMRIGIPEPKAYHELRFADCSRANFTGPSKHSRRKFQADSCPQSEDTPVLSDQKV